VFVFDNPFVFSRFRIFPERFRDVPEPFGDIPEPFRDVPESFRDIPEAFRDVPCLFEKGKKAKEGFRPAGGGESGALTARTRAVRLPEVPERLNPCIFIKLYESWRVP
jgi:hypothetical protein